MKYKLIKLNSGGEFQLRKFLESKISANMYVIETKEVGNKPVLQEQIKICEALLNLLNTAEEVEE